MMSSKSKKIKCLVIFKIDICRDLFDQEHVLLNYLHHPNLVRFYGYTSEQNCALVEHTDLSDLYTYLIKSKNVS